MRPLKAAGWCHHSFILGRPKIVAKFFLAVFSTVLENFCNSKILKSSFAPDEKGMSGRHLVV